MSFLTTAKHALVVIFFFFLLTFSALFASSCSTVVANLSRRSVLDVRCSFTVASATLIRGCCPFLVFRYTSAPTAIMIACCRSRGCV